MREISLTQGQVAKLDDEDYKKVLSLCSWRAHKTPQSHTFYAIGQERNNRKKRKTFIMHRIIMSAPSGMDVDHIDGDGLNNQKKNLRICTHSQNLMNQKLRANSKTGYKGVIWLKREKRFKASLIKEGKLIFEKYFLSKEEASFAYDEQAKIHFGVFAKPNHEI